ncbi:MAG: hypothetical protein QOD84_948 [Acidobacteriaceae bacterium]
MKYLAYTSWLFSALVLLCGCGGTSVPPTGSGSGQPPQGAASIAGNWQFSTTSAISATPSLMIAGSINQSGRSVSGSVHVNGSNCFPQLITMALTGAMTGGTVSLTSASVAGQVLSFTGSISNILNGTASSFAGTYTINGGCANSDHGNVTGIKIPVLANVLNGTLSASGGQTFDLAASDAQNSVPSSDGSFGISGNVTFTTSCFSSGTITPGTLASGSSILGTSVVLVVDTGNATLTFAGTLDRGKGEITGNYAIAGGACDQTGTGILTIASPWDY